MGWWAGCWVARGAGGGGGPVLASWAAPARRLRPRGHGGETLPRGTPRYAAGFPRRRATADITCNADAAGHSWLYSRTTMTCLRACEIRSCRLPPNVRPRTACHRPRLRSHAAAQTVRVAGAGLQRAPAKSGAPSPLGERVVRASSAIPVECEAKRSQITAPNDAGAASSRKPLRRRTTLYGQLCTGVVTTRMRFLPTLVFC